MQEIDITLFVENSQVSFITDKVSGYFNSLIIEASNKIELIIESEHGYLVFKDKELLGPYYIAPRVRAQAEEEHLLDRTQFDKFLLNEQLIITAMGAKGTQVKLKLRID